MAVYTRINKKDISFINRKFNTEKTQWVLKILILY